MPSLADFNQATASGICLLNGTGTPVRLIITVPTSLLPTCLHTLAIVLKIKVYVQSLLGGKKKKLRQIHQQPS